MLLGQKFLDILLATYSLFRTRVDAPAVCIMVGGAMACALTTAGATTTVMATAHATTQRGDANVPMTTGAHTARWHRFLVQAVENMAAALEHCSLMLANALTATRAPTVKLTLAVDAVFTDHVM